MTRALWLNWRVVASVAVVAGFALAHAVDWCIINGRAALDRLADRATWQQLRARGLACIRELPTRQSRRRQQREYVADLARRAADTPKGRALTRAGRRDAARALVRAYRNVSKQPGAQK